MMPKELSTQIPLRENLYDRRSELLLYPRYRFALALPLLGDGDGPDFILISLFLFVLTLLWRHETRAWKREKTDLQRQKNLFLQRAEYSERRFRDLLENAGDAIFFIDPQTGSLLESNRQAEDLLGYTTEEIEILSLTELFSARQKRRYLRLVKRVLAEGYGEERNLTFRRKDGSLFIGAVHARLGNLGERKVVHGTLRDVSEVWKIENEIRRKNRDLTLLNELSHLASDNRSLGEMLHEVLARVLRAHGASGGGIYLLREDRTGLFLAVHHGIERDLAASIENIPIGVGLVGKAASSGQPKTSSDIMRDHRFRSETARKDGWKSFYAIPLLSKERTVGVLCLFKRSKQILNREDIRLMVAVGKQLGGAVESAELFDALQWQHRMTRASNEALELSQEKLKESVQKLEEANRTLENLDRMKNNFLALASHELRTPLTYILTAAEYLAERGKGNSSNDEKRSLEAILAGGERLRDIVNDLLEMARLESKNLYLGREEVDIGAMLRDIEKDFRPIMAARELNLKIREVPSSVYLFGDPDYLKRAIFRLVENAVKFTRRGGRIEIDFSLWTAEKIREREEELKAFSVRFFQKPIGPNYFQMSVRDTGIGIAPEERIRIFDKFYEVGDHATHFTSSTEFGGKGFGLGLTLVRGMTEAHGGMVWVESHGTGYEKGSTFNLLLPLFDTGDYGSGRIDTGLSGH